MNRFYRVLFVWLGIAFLLSGLYLVFVEWVWQAVYYFVWVLGAGSLFLWQRDRIAAVVQRWRAPAWVRFAVLGYGMVLLEEVLAALCNHLSEGFSLPLYLVRVGQFWAFNILAFTGLIWGWYVLMIRFRYSHPEASIWVGVYGFVAEHGLTFLKTNPVLAFVLFPLNFFTYALILSPALLAVADTSSDRRCVSPWLRALLGIGLPLLLAWPWVTLLMILRAHLPGLFPPKEFLP